MNLTEKPQKNWYDKSYKYFFFFPVLITILAVIYLFNFQSANGDIIFKDVTLTGGTTITVFDASISTADIYSQLSNKFPDLIIREISDLRTHTQRGFIIETQADVAEIKPALEETLRYNLNQENSSVEFSGSTLSQGFYKQLRFAIFLAFIFMAIVVLLIFRTIIPSVAVIFAALSDIILTISVVDIIGMPLSTAGIVAFLLLVGYSVDTDILLTTRVLKKKEGTINDRISGALKTGLIMTLTSIAAVTVALLTIRNTSEVLRQMFTILLIGLGFDLFNTWLTNASIIKWYAERKENAK